MALALLSRLDRQTARGTPPKARDGKLAIWRVGSDFPTVLPGMASWAWVVVLVRRAALTVSAAVARQRTHKSQNH